MSKFIDKTGTWLTIMCLALYATAAEIPSASTGEMFERDRWVNFCFPPLQADQKTDETRGTISLVSGGINWWDRVQHNSAWGKPFRLNGQMYDRGLFTHAPCQVKIMLPEPAVKLEAVAGIINMGTVVFMVRIGDSEIYRSEVLKGQGNAVVVSVDLQGTKELILGTEDAGDGIGGDHSVWADARVTLRNGRVLWLGDMPIIEKVQNIGYQAGEPFSFLYNGQSSRTVLKDWNFQHTTQMIDPNKIQDTLVYTDPQTGLEVRCVIVCYQDFPTVEWTLYFKNTSSKESPLLENILSFDMSIEGYPPSDGRTEFILHHYNGSVAREIDYGPNQTLLAPGTVKRIAPVGGRSTNHSFCCFNLDWAGEGLILALGWPGQWFCEFARDDHSGLHIRSGQEVTHLKLLPGEEIRTPLTILQFWKGDRIRSQNIWRRWMKACSMPRPGGHIPQPQLAASSSRCYSWMYAADEDNQKMFIDRYTQENIPIDYWWMDTGWYTAEWLPDPKRFPNGMSPISERARQYNAGTILWFEVERVAPESPLFREHPEWVLKADTTAQMLLDFGNPEALQWVNDRVHKVLSEGKVDYYRVDFNMDPLDHWRQNEKPDRRGAIENHWVNGFLAHWDELVRRNPSLRIDCCASGGRRNDMETMRRAVPLWRSDYTDRSWLPELTWTNEDARGMQCQTYGISFWLPYHGHSNDFLNPYILRSNLYPAIASNFDMRQKESNYDALRAKFNLWRRIAGYFLGDYYPITPYSLEADVWMVWQFDDPENGGGVIQAFQREESIYETVRVKLRGLDRQAHYRVEDIDKEPAVFYSGGELMDKGIGITTPTVPGAAIVIYQKQ
ncbi:MAG: alpha-galactosidase [Desulfococcus multivorans]|jgi:alpha-galactosidase|nr:alpha-galactosidase [Desulfococcus multivorans]